MLQDNLSVPGDRIGSNPAKIDFTTGLAIGVDIGGTKIRSGLVNQHGEVLGDPYSIPTGGEDDPDSIIDRIRDSVSVMLKRSELSGSKILGIGLGVTGPLDIRNGLILECPQLPTLHYFPLREKISALFGLPVRMNNDANALILGESIWGAGKDKGIVLGFTLGTGLGCAIVSRRILHLGTHELSGEIWPAPYLEGTIEDYVSGRGISEIYQRITGIKRSALEIGQLGEKRDPEALTVWHTFGEALGFAMAWTINFLDPDMVVVGGSIANSFPLFEKSMHAYLKRFLCPAPSGLAPVVKASLGDQAGFIGAAGLVFTDQ
jgi:glucokinase